MKKLAILAAFIFAACTRSPQQTATPTITPLPTRSPTATTPNTFTPEPLCPPPVDNILYWKGFPAGGLEILTTDMGRVTLEALPPEDGISVLRVDPEGEEYNIVKQPNDELASLTVHPENHFSLQTWACEEETYYRFVPPIPPATPFPSEERVCAPSRQFVDLASAQLIQPEWRVWDEQPTEVVTAEDVLFTFYLEGDGMLSYDVVGEFAQIRRFSTTNAYGETLKTYHVITDNGLAWGPVSFYICPGEEKYISDNFSQRRVPFIFGQEQT